MPGMIPLTRSHSIPLATPLKGHPCTPAFRSLSIPSDPARSHSIPLDPTRHRARVELINSKGDTALDAVKAKLSADAKLGPEASQAQLAVAEGRAESARLLERASQAPVGSGPWDLFRRVLPVGSCPWDLARGICSVGSCPWDPARGIWPVGSVP